MPESIIPFCYLGSNYFVVDFYLIVSFICLFFCFSSDKFYNKIVHVLCDLEPFKK